MRGTLGGICRLALRGRRAASGCFWSAWRCLTGLYTCTGRQPRRRRAMVLGTCRLLRSLSKRQVHLVLTPDYWVSTLGSLNPTHCRANLASNPRIPLPRHRNPLLPRPLPNPLHRPSRPPRVPLRPEHRLLSLRGLRPYLPHPLRPLRRLPRLAHSLPRDARLRRPHRPRALLPAAAGDVCDSEEVHGDV